MYRLGVVTRTDPGVCRVKVRFPARDNVESWWLDVLQPKTHRDKVYWVPDVGEHVACFLDAHGEDGVVAGAIYSSADPTPVASQDKRHTLHDDGTIEEYDRAAGHWLLDMRAPSGSATVLTGATTVEIKPDRVMLQVGSTTLTLTDGGMTLEAPDVEWTLG